MSGKQIQCAGIVGSTLKLLAVGIFCATAAIAAQSGTAELFARVNGKPVGQDVLQQKIEELYPRVSVHGNLDGSPELRHKATEEVILDELIWQEAVRNGRSVTLSETKRQMFRIRRRYGARAFDAQLRATRLSRQQYLKKLQRVITIQRARKEHVELPSRVDAKAVHDYYAANTSRFQQPERVRVRLILVSVDDQAPPEVERQAKKKADDLYAQLKAHKDFADLASQFSDDMYRVRGGDVGWMHKGTMDKEFEPIAFSLPVGQFTEPFRTSLGYSILKVEARESATMVGFEEIRDKLKAQLQQLKAKQLRETWETALKKNARVEIVKAGPSGANGNGRELSAEH